MRTIVTPDDRGDVAAARKLIADAGVERTPSLRLAYSPDPVWFPLAAQAVQASLARAGIDVELVQPTSGDLYGRLLTNPETARRGEWDLAMVSWIPDWFGVNNGRSVIPPLFDGRHLGANSTNFGRYHNGAVDAAIDRANTAPTARLAEQAWRDAARRLMDDVAVVPLVDYKVAFARSRRLRSCNWTVLGLNCDATAVWLPMAGPHRKVSDDVDRTPAHRGAAAAARRSQSARVVRHPDGVLDAVRGISFTVIAERSSASLANRAQARASPLRPWWG